MSIKSYSRFLIVLVKQVFLPSLILLGVVPLQAEPSFLINSTQPPEALATFDSESDVWTLHTNDYSLFPSATTIRAQDVYVHIGGQDEDKDLVFLDGMSFGGSFGDSTLIGNLIYDGYGGLSFNGAKSLSKTALLGNITINRGSVVFFFIDGANMKGNITKNTFTPVIRANYNTLAFLGAKLDGDIVSHNIAGEKVTSPQLNLIFQGEKDSLYGMNGNINVYSSFVNAEFTNTQMTGNINVSQEATAQEAIINFYYDNSRLTGGIFLGEGISLVDFKNKQDTFEGNLIVTGGEHYITFHDSTYVQGNVSASAGFLSLGLSNSGFVGEDEKRKEILVDGSATVGLGAYRSWFYNTDLMIKGGNTIFRLDSTQFGNDDKWSNITVDGGTLEGNLYYGSNIRGNLVLKSGNITLGIGEIDRVNSSAIIGGNVELEGGNANFTFQGDGVALGGHIPNISSEKLIIKDGTHQLDFKNKARLFSDVEVSGGVTNINFIGDAINLGSSNMSGGFGDTWESISSVGEHGGRLSRDVAKLKVEGGKLVMNFSDKAELWRPDFDISDGIFELNLDTKSAVNTLFNNSALNGLTDGGLIRVSQAEGKSTNSTVSIKNESKFQGVIEVMGGNSKLNIESGSVFTVMPLVDKAKADSPQHFTVSGGESSINITGARSEFKNPAFGNDAKGLKIEGGRLLLNVDDFGKFNAPIEISGGVSEIFFTYKEVLGKQRASVFIGDEKTNTFKVRGGKNTLSINGGSLFKGLLEVQGGVLWTRVDGGQLGGSVKLGTSPFSPSEKGDVYMVVTGGDSVESVSKAQFTNGSSFKGSLLVKGGTNIMDFDNSSMTIKDVESTKYHNDFIVLGGYSEVSFHGSSTLALGTTSAGENKPWIYNGGGVNKLNFLDTTIALNGDFYIGGGETILTLDNAKLDSSVPWKISNKSITELKDRYTKGSNSEIGIEEALKISDEQALELMKSSKFTLNLKNQSFHIDGNKNIDLTTPYTVNMYGWNKFDPNVDFSSLMVSQSVDPANDSMVDKCVTINAVEGKNLIYLDHLNSSIIHRIDAQGTWTGLTLDSSDFKGNANNFSVQSDDFALTLTNSNFESTQTFVVEDSKSFSISSRGGYYGSDVWVRGGNFKGDFNEASFEGKLYVESGVGNLKLVRPDRQIITTLMTQLVAQGRDWREWSEKWMPTLQIQKDGILNVSLQNDIPQNINLIANGGELNIAIDTRLQIENHDIEMEEKNSSVNLSSLIINGVEIPPIPTETTDYLLTLNYGGSSGARVFLATQIDELLEDSVNEISENMISINKKKYKEGFVAYLEPSKAQLLTGSSLTKAELNVINDERGLVAKVGRIFAGKIDFFEQEGIGGAHQTQSHTIELQPDAIFINSAPQITATLNLSTATKFVQRGDVTIDRLMGNKDNVLLQDSTKAETIFSKNTIIDLQDGQTTATFKEVKDLNNAIFKISLNGASSDKIIIEGISNTDNATLTNYLQPFFSSASLSPYLVAQVKKSTTGDLKFEIPDSNRQIEQGFDVIKFDLNSLVTKQEEETSETNYFIQLRGATIRAADSSQAVSAINSNQLIFLANMNNLNKRLGELRDNVLLQGSWARVFSGLYQDKTEVKISNQFTNIQAGYDYVLSSKPEGINHYIGLALGYGYNSLSSEQNLVSGKANLFELGGYYSYIADAGFYSDTILKYSYISSHLDLEKNYDLNTQYFSVGEEFGYRFYFKNKFFVEPQAEFILGYGGSGEINQRKQDYFLDTKYKGGVVFRSRAGSVFGYSLRRNAQQTDFRIGASYQGDFFSEQIKLKTNLSEVEKPISSDNMGIVSFSLNHNLSDKWRFYLDIETGFGTHFNEAYLVSLGGRYAFGKTSLVKQADVSKQANHWKKLPQGYYLEVHSILESQELTQEQEDLLKKYPYAIEYVDKDIKEAQGNSIRKVGYKNYLLGVFKTKDGAIKNQKSANEIASKLNNKNTEAILREVK